MENGRTRDPQNALNTRRKNLFKGKYKLNYVFFNKFKFIT